MADAWPTHVVAKRGYLAVSFDIVDHPEQDVLSPENWRWVNRVVDRGALVGVWIGLVCSTWSMARRNASGKKGWPAPLRDSEK